jgi:hypothetical protein
VSGSDRFAVFQDLVVRSVEHAPPLIRVSVADADGPCGTVTYSFVDEDDRRSSLAALNQWREDATPLTYVRGAGDGALVDDRRLLRRALEEPGLGG